LSDYSVRQTSGTLSAGRYPRRAAVRGETPNTACADPNCSNPQTTE